MSELLYIESSPRKERSKSIAVAKAFLDEYQATHPDDEVISLDLWDTELPEFDGFTIDAKGMDLQRGYLDLLLKFIGFTEVASIIVEPTLGPAEDVARVEVAAAQQARSLAATF